MKGVKPPATSPSSQHQLRFNEDSLADKKSETGFNFFYTGGLLGDLGTVKLIPRWRPILVVNTDVVLRYVSINSIVPNTLLAVLAVNAIATGDGAVAGIITVDSLVGFAPDDHITISDGNSVPISGYWVAPVAAPVPAVGSLTALSGVPADPTHIADGDTFTLNDGVNPAIKFVVDSDGSVVPTPILKAVNFTVLDTNLVVAASIQAAINAVGATLAITAAVPVGALVGLTNDAGGAFGNVPIIEAITVGVGTLIPVGMLLGGQPIHIQDRPSTIPGGVDVNLAAYTVVQSAHMMPFGAVCGAIRNANIDTFTTTTAHGYYVGQSILIAGVTDAIFNGTRIITSVPSPTIFTTAQVAANSYSGGGTTDMGVPTGATSGIVIPSNGGYRILASGPNTQIIASGANVFAYIASDNVVDIPEGNLHG